MIMALAVAPAALAEDAATPLPLGATFEMDGPALVEAIGGDAEFVPYFEDDDTETGNIQLSNVDLGIGGMTATFACFDVQRINSAREPRLSLVSVTLDPGDNSIASFRSALEALTGVYGRARQRPLRRGRRGHVCGIRHARRLLGQGRCAHLPVAAAHV